MKENLDLGLKDKVAIVAGGGSYSDCCYSRDSSIALVEPSRRGTV